MSDTLLVTGIHREEPGFGDRVAEGLEERSSIDLLRIPMGVSHGRSREEGDFYYETRHQEIYPQLRQQVKGRYRAVIDLRSGVNEGGHCADIHTRDVKFSHCLSQRLARGDPGRRVRLVAIVAEGEGGHYSEKIGDVPMGARTSIPEAIWNDEALLYVGLEIFLRRGGEGEAEEWRFTRELIDLIQACIETEEDRGEP